MAARLDAATLAARFGPGSEIARSTVGALLRPLCARTRGPAREALARWRAGLVCGDTGEGDACSWGAALAGGLGLDAPGRDPHALLFATHSYLALLLKLLALGLVERAVQSVGARGRSGTSLLERCAAAPDGPGLGRLLGELEEEDPWTPAGLPGFTRGDPYGWYPRAWSAGLAQCVGALAREVLAVLSPCGSTGVPPSARRRGRAIPAPDPRAWVDPAKALYEALLPSRLRRSGGEYFTPDWLAELAADEAGYDGDPTITVADPACGSGTFLALAIARLRARLGAASAGGRDHDLAGVRAREHDLAGARGQVLAAIVRRVQGCDLNPLAVLAARTTYLLAVSDLVGPDHPTQIPVHLGDALLDPVPVEPADLILSNPPWIRWSALGDDYRRRLWPLWRTYGLLSARGYQARLATAEVDLAMLFLYASADRWTGPRGKLALVLTVEPLRAKAAGEGFRRFRIEPAGTGLRPVVVHDLTALGPFAAANKSGLIVLRKGESPVWPVPYVVWSPLPAPPRSARTVSGPGRSVCAQAGGRRPLRKATAGRLTLGEVRAATIRRALTASPSGPADTGPWRVVAPEDARLVARLQRPGQYRARRGASTDPYAVHHLELLGPGAGGRLQVANLPQRGKVVAPRIVFDCERELLYPAIRGRDVRRWSAVSNTLVLCPNRSPLRADLPSEEALRKRCPHAFAYLARHKDLLLARASYWAFYGRDTELDRLPRSRSGRHYRWTTRPGRPGRVVQVSVAPFFAWRDIGAYSFARWKVVWGRMAGNLAAAVVGRQPLGGVRRPVLPLDTTAFIPCATGAEAHFLCALLNTQQLNRALRSFSSPGRGFAAPSVVGALALERFVPRDARHARLARLSLCCHAAVRHGDPSALERAEWEIEQAAAGLWGLAQAAARPRGGARLP